jgi:hypothetical protein
MPQPLIYHTLVCRFAECGASTGASVPVARGYILTSGMTYVNWVAADGFYGLDHPLISKPANSTYDQQTEKNAR